MKSTTYRILAGGLVLTGALALGGGVTFTVAPTVLKVGDGAKISFAVSTTTDVEVAVLAVDGQGNLYVLEQAYDGHFPGPYDIRVFDRTGAYPGFAPFSGWRRSDCCVCRTPRFDLDPYGRLYIPNAVTCSA